MEQNDLNVRTQWLHLFGDDRYILQDHIRMEKHLSGKQNRLRQHTPVFQTELLYLNPNGNDYSSILRSFRLNTEFGAKADRF